MQRFWEVDSLRGIAVIAMVAFHAFFDLNLFAGYSFQLTQGALLGLGRFAAIAFVSLAGLSLTLSYNKAKTKLNNSQLLKKFLKRGTKIFLLGLVITAFTLLFFPQGAIWFGVLHLIGAATIIGLPFAKKPRASLFFFGKKSLGKMASHCSASLFLGIAIILAGVFAEGIFTASPWLLWLGLKPFGFTSFDYFPLLPWLGIFLLGIFAGNCLYPEAKRKFAVKDYSQNAAISFLCFLGRNSLLIYFLHQPVLVAAILLLA